MELQHYLRTKGLISLQSEYKIKANRHQKFNNLVCLKYSQLESPLEQLIVQQCRGIILDEANNWSVVSYPYDKFFNYGESSAADVNWDNAVVYEKLDGSLMTLFFYQGEWRVQSSGTADASGKVPATKYSFKYIFWQVWQQLGYQLPEDKKYCFMFELMTPYNKIVVRQLKNKLVLHGVRNISNLQEDNPVIWGNKYNWKTVKTYPFNDLATVLQITKTLDPLEREGYIVCDNNFNRIKIKNIDYVQLSYVKSTTTTRKILEIVVNNEGEEFLNYFPEYLSLYNQLKEQYESLVTEITTTYQKYKDISVQKDFALAIKHLPYSGIFFALRAGKISSVRECLKNTTIHKLESLLDLDKINFIV